MRWRTLDNQVEWEWEFGFKHDAFEGPMEHLRAQRRDAIETKSMIISYRQTEP